MPANGQNICTLNEFRLLYFSLLKGFPSSSFSCMRASDPRFPPVMSCGKKPPLTPRWNREMVFGYLQIIYYEDLQKYHSIRRQRLPVYLQIYTGYRSFLKFRHALIRKKMTDKSPLYPAEISRLNAYMHFVKQMKEQLSAFAGQAELPAAKPNSAPVNRELLSELKYAGKTLDDFFWLLHRILRKYSSGDLKLSMVVVFGRSGTGNNRRTQQMKKHLSEKIREITEKMHRTDAELKVCHRKLYSLLAGYQHDIYPETGMQNI